MKPKKYDNIYCVSGACPTCKTELDFDNDDRKQGSTECPECNNEFKLNKSLKPQYGYFLNDQLLNLVPIEGNCPHCKSELVFGDEERFFNIAECPTCSKVFDIRSAKKKIFKVNQQTANEVNGIEDIQLVHSVRRLKSGEIKSYYCTVFDNRLEKSKKLIANNEYLLDRLINEQVDKYKQEWAKLVKGKSSKKITNEIQDELDLYNNLLLEAIKLPKTNHFSKKTSKFKKEKPVKVINEPTEKDAIPKLSFIEQYISFLKDKRDIKRENYLASLKDNWDNYNKAYLDELKRWENSKKSHNAKNEKYNKEIDSLIDNLKKSKEKAVEDYFSSVLTLSPYPNNFPKKIDLEYQKVEKILIVEKQLPDIKDMPQVKEVRYIKSRNEFKDILLTDKELDRLYTNVLYSLPIRSIYEVFRYDDYNNIDGIVFNGYVNRVNKATGKHEDVYILSIFVKKDDFNKLDLKKVDVKSCFRGLKGVASSKLAELAPIPLISNLSKNDKRIVDGKDVMHNIDDRVNIAAMDWEEFEHLVREVFSKEFEKDGMEVEVTQSSRDLGVDAIAFDPDPIKGGKIIIQAKRYTNTVKVESVRALYGIMQDEGAMKGIIVTTSDYGPDAYKFAQGKPIALVNGNNLLSLLEKYGTAAKIDLKEAKDILKSLEE